jgi:hypothetical protein
MRYYVQRGKDESGPFTFRTLRRRVDNGEIFLSDQVRSLDSPTWVPVGQFLATIADPAAAVHSVPVPAGGLAPVLPAEAIPPNLHWVIILLLSPLTLSIFPAVWSVVQAAWVRRIRPQSRALFFLLPAIGAGVLARGVQTRFADAGILPLLWLAGFVLFCCSEAAMTRDLEAYYNSTENIHLKLSGTMVFFFNVFYFQYHLSRIARWKKTGVLQP